MINYQYTDSKLLFVGINPHDGSFSRGISYSNNKMFWYLLSRSGIINESIETLRNDKELKKVYEEKFNRVYKLGFVNIIDRPSRDVSLLKKGEELPGIKIVDAIIREYQPPIVCFIGKITYQKFTGQKNVDFGWQPDLYKSKI